MSRTTAIHVAWVSAALLAGAVFATSPARAADSEKEFVHQLELTDGYMPSEPDATVAPAANTQQQNTQPQYRQQQDSTPPTQ